MKDRDAFSVAKSSGGRVVDCEFAPKFEECAAAGACGFRRRSAALGWRDMAAIAAGF